MYLRPCYRKQNGKRHAYWALVESYRTERGPRQRVVAYLGQMDERGRLGVKHAAEGRSWHQRRLFDDAKPRWVEVDVEGGVEHETQTAARPARALGRRHQDLDGFPLLVRQCMSSHDFPFNGQCLCL
jgi:hypothetical protein